MFFWVNYIYIYIYIFQLAQNFHVYKIYIFIMTNQREEKWFHNSYLRQR